MVLVGKAMPNWCWQLVDICMYKCLMRFLQVWQLTAELPLRPGPLS